MHKPPRKKTRFNFALVNIFKSENKKIQDSNIQNHSPGAIMEHREGIAHEVILLKIRHIEKLLNQVIAENKKLKDEQKRRTATTQPNQGPVD